MFIPEVIFCIATTCYLVSSPPQETEEACRERIALVMIPVLRQTVPSGIVRAVRCLPAPEDPAA
jgi:hypothetical protein